MINNLLATLFFKVAVLLLEWTLKDPRIIGWYSTAYKYIDAVGIIPAYFTIAIFPMMSRYAATAKGSLLRAYRLAIKLLLIIAAPCALLGCALSRELIMVLGGAEYLPQAALILQVMIWYMPFGFINSVTQYVLIALGQQRFLTRAFAIGLAFSVVANLVAINRFGYMASAYIAILAEIVLFVPFYIGIRRHLAHMPWLRLAGKQALSILPMAGLFLFLPHQWLAVSAIGGMILYVVGLAVLRVFDSEEQEVMGRVLPVERLWGRMRTALSRAR
jgi:O-antigen/teichoic acid export membrane protein